MQSALSGCNWPCQSCFCQTVSSTPLSLSLALSLPLTRARSGVQEMQLAAGQLRDEIDVMKTEKGKGNGKWRLEMMKEE